MSKAIAGTVYAWAGGDALPLAGSVSISPWLFEREGKVGPSGPAGFSQTPRIPYIEVALFNTADIDLQSLANITAGTITVELINGEVWVLMDAYTTSAPDLDATEGEYTIRFEGSKCKKTRDASAA